MQVDELREERRRAIANESVPVANGLNDDFGDTVDQSKTKLLARHLAGTPYPTHQAEGTCAFAALATAFGCQLESRWVNDLALGSLAAQEWVPEDHPIGGQEAVEYRELAKLVATQEGWGSWAASRP